MVENRLTGQFCKLQQSHQSLQTIPVARLGCKDTHFRLYFFIDGRELPVQDISKQVGASARRAADGHPPYKGPISVAMRLHLASPEEIDLESFSKEILQGMEGIIFEEESQVKSLNIRDIVMKDAPGVMVIIEEL